MISTKTVNTRTTLEVYVFNVRNSNVSKIANYRTSLEGEVANKGKDNPRGGHVAKVVHVEAKEVNARTSLTTKVVAA